MTNRIWPQHWGSGWQPSQKNWETNINSQSDQSEAPGTALRLFRLLVLAGYFGMLLLLLNWFTWLSPPEEIPRALLLIVLVVPLMFPLQGLLKGRPYTHAWASFLALFYFAIGIDTAFNRGEDRLLALALTVFSLLFFIGCTLFARYEKRRLASLPERAAETN